MGRGSSISLEEHARMYEMFRAGATDATIANAVGRSADTVRKRRKTFASEMSPADAQTADLEVQRAAILTHTVERIHLHRKGLSFTIKPDDLNLGGKHVADFLAKHGLEGRITKGKKQPLPQESSHPPQFQSPYQPQHEIQQYPPYQLQQYSPYQLQQQFHVPAPQITPYGLAPQPPHTPLMSASASPPHLLFYKSKDKQMQAQLQQLIRSSSEQQRRPDDGEDERERQLQRRIQQLEEADDALMKDLATAKVYLRSSQSRGSISRGSNTASKVVRVSRSELRELPAPPAPSHVAD